MMNRDACKRSVNPRWRYIYSRAACCSHVQTSKASGRGRCCACCCVVAIAAAEVHARWLPSAHGCGSRWQELQNIHSLAHNLPQVAPSSFSPSLSRRLAIQRSRKHAVFRRLLGLLLSARRGGRRHVHCRPAFPVYSVHARAWARAIATGA